MKVKFTKLAALLLAGVALFATGCTDYEVDIQKNADAITSLQDQIKTLQSTIATLETAADHKADVDKLNKAISDLETALNGKIADLTTEVGKKLDKTEFEAAKKNLEDAIAHVAGRVKALEDADFQGQLDALAEKVQKLDDEKASKVDLQKAVADLTTYINGEIGKLDERLQNVEKAVDDIVTKTIPAIQQQIVDLQSGKVDKADFEAYQEETAETLRLISNSIDALTKLTAGFPEDKTIKEYVDGLNAELKDYVNNELKKYVTLTKFNEVTGQLDGRLKGLESVLKSFEGEDAVKKYIDNEIAKVNNAIDELAAAHDADVETLEAAIKKVEDEVLAVKASIRSLVFVPEVYVDGVEAILIQTLTYYPQLLNEKDTEEEVAEEVEDSLVVSPKVIAKYHVIPSNADLSFLAEGDTVAFVRRDNDPFKTIRTRAKASEDFNVIGV